MVFSTMLVHNLLTFDKKPEGIGFILTVNEGMRVFAVDNSEILLIIDFRQIREGCVLAYFLCFAFGSMR